MIQHNTNDVSRPLPRWGVRLADGAASSAPVWICSGRSHFLNKGMHSWKWGAVPDGNAFSFGASAFFFTTDQDADPRTAPRVNVSHEAHVAKSPFASDGSDKQLVTFLQPPSLALSLSLLEQSYSTLYLSIKTSSFLQSLMPLCLCANFPSLPSSSFSSSFGQDNGSISVGSFCWASWSALRRLWKSLCSSECI